MKKLFLIVVFVLGMQTTSFCQESIDIDDLVGYWSSDSTNAVFWKDADGKLQMVEFLVSTGEKLDIMSLTKTDNSLVVKTYFEETNWIVESSYAFQDCKTLTCTITGDGNDTITYRKVK